METLDGLVKTKKVRYLGISNCFAYQLAKANAIAERYGYTKFISMQGHYNLLFREEEREMIPLCKEDNIALTPYSSLASGRLTRLPTETSKRLELDAFAKLKYDRTADIDEAIILRVAQLAQKYQVSMTVIALAWLLSKVSAPIVGATKPHHLDSMVEAVEFELSETDISYLEELYIAHDLVGIMAK